MSDMKNIHKEITIPNRIFLKGFELTTKEEDLRNIFIKYGSIVETNIIKDSFTGHSRGFGFITFDSQQVTEHVLETCKSIELGGVEVTVGPAKIRRRPPKYFRQNYNYNANTNNATVPPQCFPHISSNYTVSPSGLFTFYPHQPLPAMAPTQCHPVGFPQFHFIDPTMQFDSEGLPVTSGITQETNVQTYNDSDPSIIKRGSIIVDNSFPKSPMNHLTVNEVVSSAGTFDMNHCFAGHPVQQLNLTEYYSNGHVANINNQFCNVNGHQPLTEMKHPNGIAITQINAPYDHTMDLRTLAQTLPTPSINYLPITTVLAPERKNVMETNPKQQYLVETSPKQQYVMETSPKQQKNAQNVSVNSNGQEMGNKPLKNQKYIFMSSAHGKVKRVVIR